MLKDHASEVGAARDHLSTDFHALATHAEELLRATTSLSGDSIDAARQRLTSSIQQVRNSIGPAQTYALERTQQALGSAVVYVRERPWQSLAVAVLLGLVVGVASVARGNRHG